MKYFFSTEMWSATFFFWKTTFIYIKKKKKKQPRTILTPEAAVLMLPSVFVWVSVDIYRGLVIILSARSMIWR